MLNPETNDWPSTPSERTPRGPSQSAQVERDGKSEGIRRPRCPRGRGGRGGGDVPPSPPSSRRERGTNSLPSGPTPGNTHLHGDFQPLQGRHGCAGNAAGNAAGDKARLKREGRHHNHMCSAKNHRPLIDRGNTGGFTAAGDPHGWVAPGRGCGGRKAGVSALRR